MFNGASWCEEAISRCLARTRGHNGAAIYIHIHYQIFFSNVFLKFFSFVTIKSKKKRMNQINQIKKKRQYAR